MNIVICEDDKYYRNYLEKVITNYINKKHLKSQLVLSTGEPQMIIDYIKSNVEVSLYYLDIKLTEEISGLDLAELVRRKDYLSHIIFITNYREMMPLTYEYKLGALDYIVKEDSETVIRKICEGIDYAEKRQRSHIQCLNVENRNKNVSIPLSSLCYIESVKSSHRLNLYYDNGMMTVSGLLKDIEKQLDGRFLRCHKSSIVNMDKVVEVDKKNKVLILNAGYRCVYSARYKGVIEK